MRYVGLGALASAVPASVAVLKTGEEESADAVEVAEFGAMRSVVMDPAAPAVALLVGLASVNVAVVAGAFAVVEAGVAPTRNVDAAADPLAVAVAEGDARFSAPASEKPGFGALAVASAFVDPIRNVTLETAALAVARAFVEPTRRVLVETPAFAVATALVAPIRKVTLDAAAFAVTVAGGTLAL